MDHSTVPPAAVRNSLPKPLVDALTASGSSAQDRCDELLRRARFYLHRFTEFVQELARTPLASLAIRYHALIRTGGAAKELAISQIGAARYQAMKLASQSLFEMELALAEVGSMADQLWRRTDEMYRYLTPPRMAPRHIGALPSSFGWLRDLPPANNVTRARRGAR